MKTVLLLISATIALAALPACKSSKPASSAAATASGSTAQAGDPASQAEPVYRVIVSFTSKGAGTVAEKREAFLKYVESHPRKPAYKTVLWGREGETDYCLLLTELSKKEQLNFVEELKKAMAGSDQVIITENAECQHRGRG